MEKINLSALLVIHNEEAQLRDCLQTLMFADEIIVVLDKCTDGSKAIALEYADKIIEGAWEIEGDRRNLGLQNCNGHWILEVDADERITPELADEITKTVLNSPASYHLIPVDNYIGTKLVRNGWGGSFGVRSAPRLSRKGEKVWGNQRLHPSVTFAGKQGDRLKNPIIHYVDKNIFDMIARLNRYSEARAKDLRASGKIGSFAGNLRRFFSRFFKCYVRRKGYQEGGYGFLIALCAGLYPLLSYLKAKLESDNGA